MRTDRYKASHIIIEESDTESEGEVSRNRNNEHLKKSKTIKISLTKREREQLKQISYVGADGQSHIDSQMLLGLTTRELS